MRKITVVLLALLLQASVTQAVTVTSRVSAPSPIPRTIQAGALVPLVTVDLMATGYEFFTPVYLVVQSRSSTLIEKGELPPITLYLGDPGHLYSWGPVEFNPYQPMVIGPVYLEPNVWRTAVVSADFPADISSLFGKQFGLRVNAVAIDAMWMNTGEQVTYEGTYPIQGPLFPILVAPPAESLIVRNTTPDSMIEAGKSSVTLANFDFIALNGDVELPKLALSLGLNQGRASSIKRVSLVNERGDTLTVPQDVRAYDAEQWGFVSLNDLHVKIPQGTNHWRIVGSLEAIDIPEIATLRVSFDMIGEVRGTTFGNWILPEYDYSGSVLTILNPAPWSGSFVRYLSVGVVGNDVRMLQRILNLSPDTQVAVSGPNSPGNEGVYFGQETKDALIRFQLKYGLPGTGFAGPLTIGFLNIHPEWFSAARSTVSSVSFQEVGGTTLKTVFMQGTVQQNTEYIVEVSSDLQRWKLCGSVGKNDTTVLKEMVGTIDSLEFPSVAFFRLVEKP